MANIIFTKGAPGSGKSYFLSQHSLDAYVLTPDSIRLLFSSPQYNLTGNLMIDQQNDRRVWELLLKLLDERMRKGDFIIVDATHTKSGDFGQYKKLIDRYRYHAWCLDFSHINLSNCLANNKKRSSYKIVPEEIIRTMHARSQQSSPPSWIKNIELTDFGNWLQTPPQDFTRCKKIHHIGDIQGCASVLKEYLDQAGLHDDELYIFIGDLLDRGIENADVLRLFIDDLSQRPNVIIVEGNHDRHLWHWASEQDVYSKEFTLKTQPELESAKFDKKQIRNMCRHLRHFVYYKYGKYEIFVSHGGVSSLPMNAKLVSDRQFIGGYGHYNDYYTCDKNFAASAKTNQYSIHGHRNVNKLSTKVNDHCFNLEGEVEFAGHLRVVTLSSNNFEVIEVKNDIYDKSRLQDIDIRLPINLENENLVKLLRSNNLIIEKSFRDNISSFNFKKKAFYRKIWNEQTTKARGLFINKANFEIVARSYEKFFNIGEMDFTEYSFLKNHIKYPLQVFKKENGYLGMLGYNSQFDQLVFACKSTIDSEYAKQFERIFKERYPEREDEFKQLLNEQKLSLVFEVIDTVNDPHIIEYPNDDIVLLDAVKREPSFQKMPYTYLQELAETYGFNLKQLSEVITNANEFEAFYIRHSQASNLESTAEGFVIEDVAGMMVKLKLPYYAFWKSVRVLVEKIKVNRNARISQEQLKEPLFAQFYQWLLTQDESSLNKSLIELRKTFLRD